MVVELKISSPAVVVEGETYTFELTVKNQSTKAGTLVEALLTIGISAATKSVTLITPQESSEYFGPGEIRSFYYDMSVPLGAYGTGIISAWVDDPDGNNLTSDTEDLTIISLANLYGVVTDTNTGDPIEAVKVIIDGETIYTNANGEYIFEGLRPGTYTISFEKEA